MSARPHARGLLLLALLMLAACASGPRAAVRSEVRGGRLPEALAAYERVRASDGPDVGLLRDVAGLALELAAASDDQSVRDAAFSQLRRGRERGRSVAERLSRHERVAVRAAALALLADAGDGMARAELRGLLDETDHEARAAAQGTLDPRVSHDLAHLRSSLADPSAEVRRAALLRLRLAEPDADTRLVLEAIVRADPVVGVRVAALQALSRHGRDALASLRERLSDPDPILRMAALGALGALASELPEPAAALFGSYLATPPSASGVEAARQLAQLPEAPEALRALHYLVAALAHPADDLRAQAAVALTSLSGSATLADGGARALVDAALAARLEVETVRRARLVLAQLAWRVDATRAAGEQALRDLLRGDDVPALMAAVALVREGDAAALAKLDAALVDPRATHRRIAAAALTRDAGDPDRARAALVDDDALVRVAAAGGILAAD